MVKVIIFTFATAVKEHQNTYGNDNPLKVKCLLKAMQEVRNSCLLEVHNS